jgi:hypothetical protein
MIFQSLLPIRISLRKDYDIPELVFNQDFIEKGLLAKYIYEGNPARKHKLLNIIILSQTNHDRKQALEYVTDDH